MVWSSLSPDGSKSVKQNTAPMAANTVYTESTLNNDHFWNIGTDEDGHHRLVAMENYANTSSGAPADALIPTGMDGVFYLKAVAGGIEGFYRNVNGIVQFTPGFITGSANITSSYQNIVTVPNGTWGQIWMFTNDGGANMGFGSFKAAGGVCQAFCTQTLPGNTSTPQLPFRFGSADQVSGLNFRVRTSDAAPGTYQYRIMYWAI